MSNLTDLLPAGAGGKQVDFVASGTIGNGVTVALNSDGTVEAVAATSIPQAIGSPSVFESAQTTNLSSGFDSNSNKVVMAYRDNGNSTYGTAVVGTVSGTSISFGTPVVFESAQTNETAVEFDSNSNKIVIAYQDGGNAQKGTAIVGTVSGTSISFGTPVIFNNAQTNYIEAAFDSLSNKVVIAFADQFTPYYGKAVVGTVSGTSISFGSVVTFESAQTTFLDITFDSNSNKIVIAYTDNGNSSYGTAVIGTVSGTSISFGAPVVYTSASSKNMAIAFDSNSNKVVVAYADVASDDGFAVVGTVSGTSITFGTPVEYDSVLAVTPAIAFNSAANKIVIAYRGGFGYGETVVGTVSGTSITFDPMVYFAQTPTSNQCAIFDSGSNVVVISYTQDTGGNFGTSVVFQNAYTATNNTDFIGISDAAISDTASGSVTIKGGISTNVTGLTPNQNYYVQANGSLSTTASDVLAGKALSSTSINLDYTT